MISVSIYRIAILRNISRNARVRKMLAELSGLGRIDA